MMTGDYNEIKIQINGIIIGNHKQWTIGSKGGIGLNNLKNRREVITFICKSSNEAFEIVSYFYKNGIKLDLEHTRGFKTVYISKIADEKEEVKKLTVI